MGSDASQSLKAKYTPKSDVMLSVNDFPYMIMEIASYSDEGDCNRMLLQAACLVRFANTLHRNQSKLFIVTAIYITNNFCAD